MGATSAAAAAAGILIIGAGTGISEAFGCNAIFVGGTGLAVLL